MKVVSMPISTLTTSLGFLGSILRSTGWDVAYVQGLLGHLLPCYVA
jgi:hypothetical protein